MLMMSLFVILSLVPILFPDRYNAFQTADFKVSGPDLKLDIARTGLQSP